MKQLSIGESAPDFSTVDTEGNPLTLANVSTPIALAFLRYLGCSFCRDALTNLATQYLQIATQGVELWVFVPSTPETAKEVAQKQKLPYRLIPNPNRDIYRLYHIGEDRFLGNTLRSLSGKKLFDAAKLTLKHGHGLPEGSERQRIGAFLVDSEGILQYCFVADSILSPFPIENLQQAIDKLPPRQMLGNS